MEKRTKEELLKEIERLNKINQALMGRVERSTASVGKSFSLFESNIALNNVVKARTQDLEDINQKLQFEQNLLSTIIKALPGKIIIFDKSYVVLNVFDGTGAKIELLSKENLLNNFNHEFQVYLSMIMKIGPDVWEHEKKGLVVQKNYDFCDDSEGGRRFFRAIVTQLKDLNYLIYLRDVSESVRQQETIKTQEAQLIQSSKLSSLGEMSAGIAHEVNNPLAIIMGKIAIFKKVKNSPNGFEDRLEAMEKAAFRIQKIVSGLKKFSRTSDGHVHKTELISQILTEVTTITNIRASHFSVPVEISGDANLSIECDSLEIEQVLVNLINNAVDAVKATENPWVKVNYFRSGDKAIIQVIDSGKGITPAIENKLFEPFYTTKPVGEGTGLGLSITKGILDLHKASIRINRNFKNTCFEIQFPVIEPQQRAA